MLLRAARKCAGDKKMKKHINTRKMLPVLLKKKDVTIFEFASFRKT